jgi:two-component system KDP operon response regulator KdpE
MSRRPTVLLVEDDPDLLRFAHVTLRLGGYHVLTATDGEAALSTARRGRPAAIVLDLRLPVLDGWQVLESLSEDPGLSGIPVVVITATADVWGRPRALEAGVADYLVKPVSADDLLGALERVLAGPPRATPAT